MELTEKERLFAKSLRFLLLQKEEAKTFLEELERKCTPEEWGNYQRSLANELLFSERDWKRSNQSLFERSLKPGDRVRAYWEKEGVVYTARAIVSYVQWEQNSLGVLLDEDVEEAGVKRKRMVSLPLLQNTKRFHPKRERVAPLFQKGKA